MRHIAFIGLCSLLIGAYTADSAAAACPVENGTVYWSASVGSYMMTATQQVITVYAHANGGCTGATALAGGGTAHMSTNGGGLIEMGYRDTRNSDGSHSFQLFTEETIGGSDTVTLRNSPGCAVAGRAVTFKVRTTAVTGSQSDDWEFFYACSGGGWAQVLPTVVATGFTVANARVETFRFGPTGGGGFMYDLHEVLQYRRTNGDWTSSFGTIQCHDEMSNTNGVPHGSPYTTWWETTSSSSTSDLC